MIGITALVTSDRFFCNVRILSIILITGIIFTTSFKDVFIFVSFKMNQRYIAENLCINKDNPFSDCEGSCFLKKQLSESNEDENKQPLTFLQDNSYTVLFLGKSFKNRGPEYYESQDLRPITNDLVPESDFVFGIFHPPQS